MATKPKIQTLEILCGDALAKLKRIRMASIDCCITSPPFWRLRDFGVDGQLGLEQTPEEYIQKLVVICKEIMRVLKCRGTFWLNMGDSYAGAYCYSTPRIKQNQEWNGVYPTPTLRGDRNGMGKVPGLKPKDLCMMPARVALALQEQGWYIRSDIIWYKPNAMPEGRSDRPTKSHEYIFLLTKAEHYFYDANAIKEAVVSNPWSKSTGNGNGETGSNVRFGSPSDMRNKRSVWIVNTKKSYFGTHYATFPEKLIEPCILAGTMKRQMVLDPFAGSGTVGQVALKHSRSAVLIELNPEYIPLIKRRCSTWTMQKGDRDNLWYKMLKQKRVMSKVEKRSFVMLQNIDDGSKKGVL